MPQSDRMRLRTSSKPALDLPPPFRLVTLREVGDAFAHATAVTRGCGVYVMPPPISTSWSRHSKSEL